VNTFLEIVQHVITGAHGKGHDWHRGGLVSTVRKNTCITNVEIGNVVSAIVFVKHAGFRIVTEPAGAAGMGLVEVVVTGSIENLVRT